MPISNLRFASLAARIAEVSTKWSADIASAVSEKVIPLNGSIHPKTVEKFTSECDALIATMRRESQS